MLQIRTTRVWLKKRLTKNTTAVEKRELHTECEQLFSLELWLPGAAKKATQLSLSSHPCTFSHPRARKNKNGYATPVLYFPNKALSLNDFLYSDSMPLNSDVFGNASAIDVYKFLQLELSENKSILQHLQEDSPIVQEFLNFELINYEALNYKR